MAYLDPYVGPFGTAEAAHLLRRVAFGGTPAQVAATAALGRDGAIASLLDYPATDAAYDALVATFPNDTSDLGLVKTPNNQNPMIGWWLHRMIHGNQPAQEKLALFLHDTLVSDWPKVITGVTNSMNNGNDGSQAGQSCTTGTLPPDALRQRLTTCRLLRDQITLLRTTGHGNYATLIKAITRDPAMLLYLDNYLNTKTKPQENYGREVMELFTMGVGNYTENDVKQASKAFTGETVERACSLNWPYTYKFDSTQHDTSSKTLLGTTFNMGAGDTNFAIDLMFTRVSGQTSISPAHATQPATTLYMSWKFITWYVNEAIPIDHPAVAELATVFDTVSVNGYRYDVRETLRVLLRSQMFFDATWRWNMYKNPVEFVVTAMRALGLSETSYASTQASSLRNMGMAPFSAPNVAGWDHGEAWINSGAVIARQNYANRLSNSALFTDAICEAIITDGYASGYGDSTALIDYFRGRLLGEPLSSSEFNLLMDFCANIDGTSASQNDWRRKVRGLTHIVMSMPLYQLK